jgi:acetylornithine/succinyldiaminopimelate/putrescine aminotransferase
VPIGAVLSKEAVSVFTYGEHGTTFGGNPLVCAVGYATLKYIIDNDVLSHVKEMEAHFIAGLEKLKTKFSCIKGIRGVGLLLALVFKHEIAADMVTACLSEGLLINGVKPNAIRFMPPLIVEKKDIDNALKILDHILTGGNWNEG